MHIKLIAAVLTAAALAACQPQTPAASEQKPATADLASVQKNVQDALQKAYPSEKVQINSVTATPIAGVYEVVVFPSQVVYFDAKGQYMLIGNLIDLAKQTNLTEDKIADLNRVDYAALPLDKAIKEVRGKGERKVVVFSDPDCPFCKRLEHEIAQIDNVTVYTLLMPIASLHPQATAKAEQLWCQSDRTAAWTNWMRNDTPPAQVAACANPVADIVALGEKLGFNGTPTIVYPNGKVQAGYVAKDALDAALTANQGK